MTAMPHRRGLTLIETLVVLAAVALLIGQAVPQRRAMREAQAGFTTLSKLQQIFRASSVYTAEDPNETAVPMGLLDSLSTSTIYSAYSWGGKSGMGNSLNTDLSDSLWAGNNAMGSPHRPLNAILYKDPLPVPSSIPGYAADWMPDARLDLDLYHAPGDVGFSGMHHAGWKRSGWSSYNHYGTSFSAVTHFLSRPGQPLRSTSVYGRPLSTVPNAGNTVMYLENAGRHAHFATNPALDQSGCYWPYSVGDFTAVGADGTPFRFATAFADGRVANVDIRGHMRVPQPGGMPAECPNETCACILIRGPGWQMDTYPAASWLTHKQAGGGGGADFAIVNVDDPAFPIGSGTPQPAGTEDLASGITPWDGMGDGAHETDGIQVQQLPTLQRPNRQ